MNYVDLVKFDLSGICFSCLSSERKMYCSKRIMNCLKMIANIDIPEGVMVKVCWECMAYIDNVFRFKGTVERSYHILADYFMKNKAFDAFGKMKEIKACSRPRLQSKSCVLANFPPKQDWSMEHNIKVEPDADMGSDVSLDSGSLQERFFKQDPTEREGAGNLENSEQTVKEFEVPLVSAEGLQGGTINPKVEDSGTNEAKISPNVVVSGDDFLEGFRLFKKMQVQTVKQFRCDLCSYITNNKGDLKLHMRKHTGEKPFSCNRCSYKCAARIRLNQHMQLHTGNYKFSCKLCPYKCTHKTALTIHMRTHTGEKPFSCEICPYKSILKGNLTKHMQRHGEKPFICEICSMRLGSNVTLQGHLRTHTGEKPFSCEKCSLRFNSKRTLKSHMKTHTDEKPFSCEICSFRFHSKKTLRSHMKTHTDEKRFACELCSYRSKRRYGLKKHMRTHMNPKVYKGGLN